LTKYSQVLWLKVHGGSVRDALCWFGSLGSCGAISVFKPSAWVIAGAAVLATAGVAHAQDRAAPSIAAPGATVQTGDAVPWYQRFTTSSGVSESITGESENDRLPAPAWTLNQRWGVTVDVREAQRIDRLPEGSRGDQASVGAYYQFTPRMRVGGELSVESAERPLNVTPQGQDEEPRAGVRIESAFRF